MSVDSKLERIMELVATCPFPNPFLEILPISSYNSCSYCISLMSISEEDESEPVVVTLAGTLDLALDRMLEKLESVQEAI